MGCHGVISSTAVIHRTLLRRMPNDPIDKLGCLLRQEEDTEMKLLQSVFILFLIFISVKGQPKRLNPVVLGNFLF